MKERSILIQLNVSNKSPGKIGESIPVFLQKKFSFGGSVRFLQSNGED
jgi:hypothetical protein